MLNKVLYVEVHNLYDVQGDGSAVSSVLSSLTSLVLVVQVRELDWCSYIIIKA